MARKGEHTNHGGGPKLYSELGTAHKWRIRAGVLLQRLDSFAMGAKGVEMSANQINAAQIVLRKFVPDLSSTQMTVEHKEVLSADQIQARLQTLIAARPELLQLLNKAPGTLPPVQAVPEAVEDGELVVGHDKTAQENQTLANLSGQPRQEADV